MRYAVVLLLLAGCATTPEDRAERLIAMHGPLCDKLGFQRDTDAWRNCVLQRTSVAQSNAAAMAAAIHQARPRTCTTIGGTTTCN